MPPKIKLKLGSEITDDEVGQAIRTCLLKVKNDEVYMSHELEAKDFNDIRLGEDKSKTLHRFYRLVANTLKVTKDKKVRSFIDERLKGKDFVKKEIGSFDPNNPSKSNNAMTQSSPDNDVVVPKSMGTDEHVATKKRRRSSNGQKNNPKNIEKKKSSNNTMTFSKEEREEYAAKAKIDFEEAKQEVLNSLDSSYKELFGKIAFCKWKKDPYRPVLILSPYSVSPELRETWLTMFKNTKGDRKRMWYYTFWYGSPLEQAYTHEKRKELVLYEEAEKRGLHQLNQRIQRKIDEGVKLTKIEEQTVRGYEEMTSELAKEPSQRRAVTFQELHESFLNMEDTICVDEYV